MESQSQEAEEAAAPISTVRPAVGASPPPQVKEEWAEVWVTPTVAHFNVRGHLEVTREEVRGRRQGWERQGRE